MRDAFYVSAEELLARLRAYRESDVDVSSIDTLAFAVDALLRDAGPDVRRSSLARLCAVHLLTVAAKPRAFARRAELSVIERELALYLEQAS